jgi:uncharacterized protein (DUF488 family)
LSGILSKEATMEGPMTEGQPENTPLILTIGHSTRSFEQFTNLLSTNGVECLVDVRRFPHSPRHPQFGEESLPGRLHEQGIGYRHLPGLGGRRRPKPDSPNAGWRNPSFRGYADHMAKADFAENFRRLLELCGRGRTCIMCSEAVWWRCHRRMIADALVVRGFPVEHVLGESRRQYHELTAFAQIVDEDGVKRLVYPSEGPTHGEDGGCA